jgi:hypothetical protein
VSVQLLELVCECQEPVVLALALTGDCYLGILGTVSKESLAAAEKAATVCVEHGLPGHELWMRAYHGVFVAEMGDPARGTTIMRDAMTGLQKISAGNIDRPLWLSRLATAHASLGQIDVGLDLLADALESSKRQASGGMRLKSTDGEANSF